MQVNPLFLLAFFIIFYFICKFSHKLNLASVSRHKKRNKIKIPYTGGLSIVICGLLLQKIIDFEIIQINTILSYSALVCLLGIMDDKYNLRVDTRILFQIIIGYLIFIENLDVNSLGNFKFLGEIRLGKFALIFTIFILMLFLNSNNYIDGINGLCASLFINSISLILFFYGDILSSGILKLAYYFILISYKK
jgi:UDP-GlcNAc:undecaprenyl-phosphate GlcNAc-1-phosphate transferase